MPAGTEVTHRQYDADSRTSDNPRRRRPRWLLTAAVAGLIGAVAGGVVGGVVGADRAGQTTVVQGLAPSGPSHVAGSPSLQAVLAKVLPAVVAIRSSPSPAQAIGGGTPPTSGSGMIVTPDGDVLTNAHVVAGSTGLTVTVYGRAEPMTATVLGTDPTDDLAVIRIKGASHLPTVTFNTPGDVAVGDSVVAIGAALDLGVANPMASQGLVSATDRVVQSTLVSPTGAQALTGMVQTDAATGLTASGGPLVASDGRVVGVNTALSSPTTASAPAWVSYAVPASRVTPLLPQLERGGTVGPTDAFLGVQVVDLTPALRHAYGNEAPQGGAVVAAVTAGSAAASAGIQVGDIITGAGDSPVASASDLAAVVRRLTVGDHIDLTFYRANRILTVQVGLGGRP